VGQDGAVPENRFTGRIATEYESRWPEIHAPEVVESAVAFLAAEARGGAALELGVGTGRLALPLSRRGVRIHGIDISEDVLAQLRGRPGSEAVTLTTGDFATARVDGTFRLAYLVRNTIMNLTTQEEQVACFDNVARHLEPGGRFVMEVMVPQLRRLPPGETVRAFKISPTRLGFEEYEFATQRSWSHHYWVIDGRLETFSAPFRYVWPSELDLMARLAGMALLERLADWDRSPFTGESESHISVWEKPA
jgi:SAM-dependent methyltransferase